MIHIFMASLKKIAAVFYQTGTGKSPVREWLLDLDKADRLTIGKDIQKVEFGWPIGLPYSRPLGLGLHEVRSDISDGRIARVVFSIQGNRMVLLHGFVKKTQKTPKHDLDLALKRKKDIERHG